MVHYLKKKSAGISVIYISVHTFEYMNFFEENSDTLSTYEYTTALDLT